LNRFYTEAPACATPTTLVSPSYLLSSPRAKTRGSFRADNEHDLEIQKVISNDLRDVGVATGHGTSIIERLGVRSIAHVGRTII
jgi:hypothetical protein